MYRINRPITVLGDDHIRDILALRIRIIIILTIKEHDNIRILLE